MDKKIEMVMDDILLIKAVIEKTQKDFSKVSFYFIWIGIMNAGAFLLEQMAYFFSNTVGYGNVITGILGLGSRWFCLIGYVILFIVFYKKIKTTNNEISEGMINMS